MKPIRPLASAAAVVVLIMCVYSFLLGNKVFDSKFENEAITWYILARESFVRSLSSHWPELSIC